MSSDTLTSRTGRSHPRQGARLPAPLTELIGRERELAEAQRLLGAGVRLLTLTGAGGAGKSRLALEVASRTGESFTDGVAFIPLAPVRDPELVALSIARTLAVIEPERGSLVDALLLHLSSQNLLLVLDNFEHVVAAAPLLTEILVGCPHLSILVTSRSLLRISAEHALSVPPLELPQGDRRLSPNELLQHGAVRLFVDRASAVCGDFALSADNADAVVAICRRLDGLPLAIELAAARVALLPPKELLKRLEHRLQVLSRGRRDLPARLRTMRDAIAWSYDLLHPAEQALFRRLAVFAGGCTLETADAVLAAKPALPIDILDGLADLVDHSLMYRPQQINGEPRFLMLETIREFALEQLRACGEETVTHRTHAVYFAHVAEEAEVGLRGPEQQRWRNQLDAELDNLRAAVTWAADGSNEPPDAELGLRLAAALWYFWLQGNSPSEGRRWLLQILNVAPASADTSARGKALFAAGALAWRQGDYGTARMQLDDSVRVLRQVGDLHALADALHLVAHVLFERGEYRGAEVLFEESRARFEEMGDMLSTVPLVGDLGMVAYHRGEYTEARRIFEQTCRLSKHYGLKDRLADALNRLGDLARLAGDADRARALYEDSLTLWRESRGVPGIASALHKLGQLSRQAGDSVRARGLLLESLDLQRELGNKQGIAECLAGLAGIRGAGDNLQHVAYLLAAAARVLQDVGAPLAPADRIEFERDVEAVQAALGGNAWAAAWAKGQALTVDEAISAAVGEAATERCVAIVEPTPIFPPEIVPLSPREREVALLIARGLSNREIAGMLTITEKTAANHVDHIMTKLDLHSRTQIAVWTVHQGFESRPQA